MAAVALVSCAAPGTEAERDGDCGGAKCDLASELSEKIDSLVQKARRIDRADFASVATGFATDELNDQLAFGGVAAQLHAPEHFALHERAHGDLTLNDIDELVTGLTHRYGERELSTEVNAARQRWLRSTGDEVFSEAAFEIAASFDHGWSFETGGLVEEEGGLITVGFEAGAGLQTRIVAPFDDEIAANGEAMLQALQSSRHFIEPRSLQDIEAMRPGELWARRGRGRAGINIAYGMPTLVLNPLEWLTYRLIVSFAARARLEGQLDIQLVRLEGDEVVVDVGTQLADVEFFEIAIRDGWGVEGLLETEVEIGGIEVRIDRLVEKALERFINDKLGILDARASHEERATRISIARFRFHLDGADAELEQALAQALKGDVRLAQALALEQSQEANEAMRAGHVPAEPRVVAELDFAKVGGSVTRHLGVHLFGMHFFNETDLREGQATWQTPGGARSILFNSYRQERAWRLFSEHGFTRVGLSGTTWSAADPTTAHGEANFFLQMRVGDDYMSHDALLDQVDPFLVAVAGPTAFGELSERGNQIADLVDLACDQSDVWDACHTRITQGDADVVPDAPMTWEEAVGIVRSRRTSSRRQDAEQTLEVLGAHKIAVLRREAMDAFRGRIEGLPFHMRALLAEMGALRLDVQRASSFGGGISGPDVKMQIDYRFDDAALDHLMATTGEQLRRALGRTLGVVEVERDDIDGAYLDPYDPDRDADAEIDENVDEAIEQNAYAKRRIERLVTMWDEARAEYARYTGAAGQRYTVWQQYDRRTEAGEAFVGDAAMAIHFEVDRDRRPIYEEAALTSLATQRARVVWRLWDRMYDTADDRSEETINPRDDSTSTNTWVNDLGRQGEQTIGYTLLGLVPANNQDLSVSFRVDTDDNWQAVRRQYRAAGLRSFLHQAVGADVAPLDTGSFDIDELIYND